MTDSEGVYVNRLSRAKLLARSIINDEVDLLIACRDLAGMRDQLAFLPESVIDVVVAVSSETDGLPLGGERTFWNAENLKEKDAEAADYRERVRSVVKSAAKELYECIEAIEQQGSFRCRST